MAGLCLPRLGPDSSGLPPNADGVKKAYLEQADSAIRQVEGRSQESADKLRSYKTQIDKSFADNQKPKAFYLIKQFQELVQKETGLDMFAPMTPGAQQNRQQTSSTGWGQGASNGNQSGPGQGPGGQSQNGGPYGSSGMQGQGGGPGPFGQGGGPWTIRAGRRTGTIRTRRSLRLSELCSKVPSLPGFQTFVCVERLAALFLSCRPNRYRFDRVVHCNPAKNLSRQGFPGRGVNLVMTLLVNNLLIYL